MVMPSLEARNAKREAHQARVYATEMEAVSSVLLAEVYALIECQQVGENLDTLRANVIASPTT